MGPALALHASTNSGLFTQLSVWAITTIGRNAAIGSVVGATKELLVAIILIQVQLHPGNTHAAQHIVLAAKGAGAIGAVMVATIQFNEGLVQVTRQAIIERRGMVAHRCNDVRLAGENQGRSLHITELQA